MPTPITNRKTPHTAELQTQRSNPSVRQEHANGAASSIQEAQKSSSHPLRAAAKPPASTGFWASIKRFGSTCINMACAPFRFVKWIWNGITSLVSSSKGDASKALKNSASASSKGKTDEKKRQEKTEENKSVNNKGRSEGNAVEKRRIEIDSDDENDMGEGRRNTRLSLPLSALSTSSSTSLSLTSISSDTPSAKDGTKTLFVGSQSSNGAQENSFVPLSSSTSSSSAATVESNSASSASESSSAAIVESAAVESLDSSSAATVESSSASSASESSSAAIVESAAVESLDSSSAATVESSSASSASESSSAAIVESAAVESLDSSSAATVESSSASSASENSSAAVGSSDVGLSKTTKDLKVQVESDDEAVEESSSKKETGKNEVANSDQVPLMLPPAPSQNVVASSSELKEGSNGDEITPLRPQTVLRSTVNNSAVVNSAHASDSSSSVEATGAYAFVKVNKDTFISVFQDQVKKVTAEFPNILLEVEGDILGWTKGSDSSELMNLLDSLTFPIRVIVKGKCRASEEMRSAFKEKFSDARFKWRLSLNHPSNDGISALTIKDLKRALTEPFHWWPAQVGKKVENVSRFIHLV